MAFVLTACGTRTIDEGATVAVSAELQASDGLSNLALSVSHIALEACKTPARHSESSPTLIGEPHVVRPGEATTLGTFEPPLGRYCALVLTLSPADDDAVGADETIVGYTASLSGPGQATAQRTAAELEVELTFEPIVLDANDAQTLHVAIDTSAWLQGIDMQAAIVPDQEAKLLANIKTSVHLK